MTSQTAQDELQKEIERLRAERDGLQNELEAKGRKRADGSVRRFSVGLLAFLSALLFALTATVVWAHRLLLDTDKWVETVAPIGADPAITDALARRISTEIFEVIDVQEVAREALPERAAVLSIPLAGAVTDYVGEQVQEFLRSDRFADFWTNANRFAHTQVVAVIRDESEVVSTTNGRVTLNLLPAINTVLARIEDRAGDLLGRDINIPEISSTELPEAARAKLSAALGRELPRDFGEVVVFESDKLAAVQDAVGVFDSATLALVILTPLLIVATLWLSRSRRRTLIQMSAIAFVLFVLIRRVVVRGQTEVVDVVKPENRSAARALVDHVFTNFFSVSTLLLWSLVLLVLVAWITGPYPLSRKLRARTGALVSLIGQDVSNRAENEDARRWVGAHRDGLLLAGAVPAVLALLFFDLAWLPLLLIVAALAVFEFGVLKLGARSGGPSPPVTG